MPLTQFAGVFSRAFVVGFFMPAFFMLAILVQLLHTGSLPGAYRQASGATQVAILGGVALLGALLLSGLHYHLIRLFEGYPLQRLSEDGSSHKLRRALAGLPSKMVERWMNQFDRLNEALKGPKSEARTRAARELNRYFPWRREIILPTRLGNAIRSFETHPNKRYGLDGVTAWPRIAMLLSDAEREDITEAESDLAFFLNLTALVPLVTLAVVADIVAHPPSSPYGEALLILAALLAGAGLTWSLYQASVGAAVRWGMPVRAVFDMHRLELYAQLGLMGPRSDVEERTVARAATRCMLYGEELDEAVRDQSQSAEETK
jgi:hypothetical protein